MRSRSPVEFRWQVTPGAKLTPYMIRLKYRLGKAIAAFNLLLSIVGQSKKSLDNQLTTQYVLVPPGDGSW